MKITREQFEKDRKRSRSYMFWAEQNRALGAMLVYGGVGYGIGSGNLTKAVFVELIGLLLFAVAIWYANKAKNVFKGYS